MCLIITHESDMIIVLSLFTSKCEDVFPVLMHVFEAKSPKNPLKEPFSRRFHAFVDEETDRLPLTETIRGSDSALVDSLLE